ncbi:hypothetical protein Pme01_11530 [Planosporangium mesophilum]|uniref:Uncharacterized protein n=1 Tax=Planosporangium mesophilum TaxID=689768 RepID=A0A8J3T9J6_9ACTN|nr:hypothetical protein Pme01_11530 [Planosporangium mesophilum]
MPDTRSGLLVIDAARSGAATSITPLPSMEIALAVQKRANWRPSRALGDAFITGNVSARAAA